MNTSELELAPGQHCLNYQMSAMLAQSEQPVLQNSLQLAYVKYARPDSVSIRVGNVRVGASLSFGLGIAATCGPDPVHR